VILTDFTLYLLCDFLILIIEVALVCYYGKPSAKSPHRSKALRPTFKRWIMQDLVDEHQWRNLKVALLLAINLYPNGEWNYPIG
jgi:hypothetical protein